MSERGFLDGVARANETRQKIGAFFGGLGAIVGGVLLLVAPAEEMAAWTWRVPGGLAAIVVGVLIVVVAVTKNRRSRGARAVHNRGRYLVLAILGAAVVAAGIVLLLPRIHKAWALGARGEAATASVIRTSMQRMEKGVRYTAMVRYPGGTASLRVDTHYPPGAAVSVLYLPNDPKVVSQGSAGDSFLDLLDRDLGIGWALAFALLFVFGGVGGLVCLKRLVTGGGPPSDG